MMKRKKTNIYDWRDNFKPKRKKIAKRRGNKVTAFNSLLEAAKFGVHPGEKFYIKVRDLSNNWYGHETKMPFHPIKPTMPNNTYSKKELDAIEIFWVLKGKQWMKEETCYEIGEVQLLTKPVL